MSIYLFRHGEAYQIGELEGIHTDEERPLTPKGKKVTRQVCSGLKSIEVGCHEIWHSPLVRAVETAEIVAEEMECGNLIVKEGLADYRSGDQLFLSLKDLDPDREVFLVGHQPFLGEWLARLISGVASDDVSVSKSGVACLDPIPGVDPPRAELRWLLGARHLQSLG